MRVCKNLLLGVCLYKNYSHLNLQNCINNAIIAASLQNYTKLKYRIINVHVRMSDRSHVIWWCIFGIILHLSSVANSCPKNAYHSHDLDGCLDCPNVPLEHCQGVHRVDICSCFRHCVKADLRKGTL